MEQQSLPTLDGPVLVPGPVFLCFEIDGKPQHKARHRSRLVIPRAAWTDLGRYGGRVISEVNSKKIFIHQYPDPATEAYEKMMAQYARLLMRHRVPTIEPVALLVHAFLRVPESWSKRNRAAALVGGILPTVRPDGDNYLKIVDALNGIVWTDDSQVVDGRVIKRYSDRPGLRVEVREFVTANGPTP